MVSNYTPREAKLGKQGGLDQNCETGFVLGASGPLLVAPLIPQGHSSPTFSTLMKRASRLERVATLSALPFSQTKTGREPQTDKIWQREHIWLQQDPEG